MAVTLTYDPVLSRVRVDADGLGTATAATVERSLNGVTWETVRGAQAATVVAGELVPPVDDYEFAPNVVNQYRVTTHQQIPVLVGVGAAVAADNAPVAPPVPAGAAAGDDLVVYALARSGSGEVPVQPAGYTTPYNGGAARLFHKTHSGAEAAPSVALSVSSPGCTLIAQMAAFKWLDGTVHASNSTFVGSAQDISYPALAITQDYAAVLFLGQKYTTWTTVDELPDADELGDTSSTAGFDMGHVWDYRQLAESQNVLAGVFEVNGGSAASVVGHVVALNPVPTVAQTEDITPVLDQVWFKSVRRPFLNIPVRLCGPVVRLDTEPRNGIFPIVGRSMPIAITDVRLAPRVGLTVAVNTAAEADGLRLLLASGDVLFVHTPPDNRVPTMYVAAGPAQEQRFRQQCQNLPGLFTFEATQVAAPAASVVGTTSTYQTVLDTYATYADVLAAHPTYADLRELVASPSEVVVP